MEGGWGGGGGCPGGGCEVLVGEAEGVKCSDDWSQVEKKEGETRIIETRTEESSPP